MTARAEVRAFALAAFQQAPNPWVEGHVDALLHALRAQVLNEAADAVDEMVPALQREWPDEPSNSPWAHGTQDAARLLRTMAADTTNPKDTDHA